MLLWSSHESELERMFYTDMSFWKQHHKQANNRDVTYTHKHARTHAPTHPHTHIHTYSTLPIAASLLSTPVIGWEWVSSFYSVSMCISIADGVLVTEGAVSYSDLCVSFISMCDNAASAEHVPGHLHGHGRWAVSKYTAYWSAPRRWLCRTLEQPVENKEIS